MSAAEGEQLSGDLGGTRGLLHDVQEVGLNRRGELGLQRELAGEIDGLGDVVKVVGDAPGEAANGLHAMRVAELLFQFALAGDVQNDSPGCTDARSQSQCRGIQRERHE